MSLVNTLLRYAWLTTVRVPIYIFEEIHARFGSYVCRLLNRGLHMALFRNFHTSLHKFMRNFGLAMKTFYIRLGMKTKKTVSTILIFWETSFIQLVLNVSL